MRHQLRRLLAGEDAQDLVEYGLLAFFVVLASLATWNLIAATLGVVYTGYDSGVQNLWVPPDPGTGS